MIHSQNWNQILTLPLADSKIGQSLNIAESCTHHTIQYYPINADIVNKLGMNINGKFFLFGRVAFTKKMVEGYLLQFRKQYNVINFQNLPYLQILDVQFLFKKMIPNHIPHSLAQYSCLIEQLSIEEKKTLVRLCRKYPVYDRLVLSSVLALIKEINLSEKLLNTVNPNSRLRFYNKWSSYLCSEGVTLPVMACGKTV